MQSRVTRVTFFEDRAQVEREVRVQLPAGSHELVFSELAPALDDRSLVARSATLRIDDVRACRRWRIGKEEAGAEVRALLDESELLRNAYVANEAAVQRLMTHLGRLQTGAHLAFAAQQRELPYQPGLDRATASASLELLADVRKAEAEARGLDGERAKILAKHETVRRRFEAVKNPNADLLCEVRVQAAASEAQKHTVTLSYMVPSALWRPMHRATWLGGSLRFECGAAVWQATGEDWEDVETRYSTARSTQRAEPPVLQDDVLNAQPRQTKQTVATFHEQAIATTGAGMASDAMPGVDDGGETRLMDAARKVTIRSNGRMQRVPLFVFEAEAKADRIARPELSPLVFLRTEQVNAGKHPLLAGPVELLRESGNVGFTQLGFIAPGEKFQLSFGADDGLRILRTQQEQRETAKITGKQTIRREIWLALSNLDDREAAFTLEERVPVSELEQVEVKIDTEKTGPVPKPDSEGVVRFDVKLTPSDRKTLMLHYEILAASDVRGL
jgi:uncharacterized protein (TIGR02231 family)